MLVPLRGLLVPKNTPHWADLRATPRHPLVASSSRQAAGRST